MRAVTADAHVRPTSYEVILVVGVQELRPQGAVCARQWLGMRGNVLCEVCHSFKVRSAR